MLNKSYHFLRGQVWYWNDPIYGKKELNKGPINKNDNTLHFSRYVIIIENTLTITSSSCIVIPCSSKRKSRFDIDIPLNHANYVNTTVARISQLFPVNPKDLVRYICTLSEATMAKIETALLAILTNSNIDVFTELQSTTPSKQNVIKNDEFTIPCNCDAKCDNNEKISLINEIKDDTNTSSTETRKGRYHWSYEKIQVFLDTYKKEGIDAVCSKYGLKLNTAKRYYSNWNNRINTSSKVIKKWTSEKIKDFLDTYKKEGIDAVCNKYSITIKTAQRYYTDWSHLITNDNTKEVAATLEKESEKSDEYNRIRKNIHKVADFMTISISNMLINVADKFNKMHREKIDIDNFQYKLHLAVQGSLMQFLGMHNNSNVCITANNMKTWNYLSNVTDPIKDINIDSEWIEIFRNHLYTKIRLSKKCTKLIVNYIKNNFIEC